MFCETFDLGFLKGDKSVSFPVEQAFGFIARMKDHVKEDLENILLPLEILESKKKQEEQNHLDATEDSGFIGFY
jgi:hypothetical protein